MRKKFTTGQPYFLLHFLDQEFRFPVITSLVYLGKNLEGEGEDDLWFFQDSESHLKCGPYDGSDKTVNFKNHMAGEVYDFPENQLRGILTVQELIDELKGGAMESLTGVGMNTEFCEGEVYYRLTFPDAGLFYPQVETFVFVGKNLSDEDKEDVWYFQFADSYAKFGSILKCKDGDRKVCLATRRDLVDMLDLTGLLKELEMAAKRRRIRTR